MIFSRLVSQYGATVLATFNGRRLDVTDSVKRGSLGIGAAVDSALVEILRVNAQDFQVDYRTELLSSYRLISYYYDDCMIFERARADNH